MENRIRNILGEVKADILRYSGTQMLEDKIIDSFDVMEIVAALEDEFGIEIDPELISAENFATVKTIIEMVQASLKEG